MFRCSPALFRWLSAIAMSTPTHVLAAAPESEDAAVERTESPGSGAEDEPAEDGPAEDEPAEDEPTGEGDWDFEVEDISDDPEALAADLKEGEVQATGKVGTLTGKVLDTAGDAIPGAYVEVVGKKYMARAGVDGTFSLDLPPGTYTIVVREELHKPVEQAGIEIVAKETTTADFDLAPQGEALVVTVEADANVEGDAGVMMKRTESVASSDRMSRAEISKSGGGTANVARFIVGATVVDGRFVFVRGLGHRYGNTLLDGARVPSPEPDLRTVPLDIFPSAALGAINVQKSFTPDVPGDFAGGSIQLATREIPTEPTVSAAVELEGNTATTFRPMVYSGGFPVEDLFGFGNVPRGLPSAIPKNEKIGDDQIDLETFQDRWTPEEVEAHGESLYTDYLVRRGKNAPLNGKVKLALGNSWKTKRAGKFGVLVAAEYRNKHQTKRNVVRVFGGSGSDQSTRTVDFAGIETVQTVSWSSLALAKWDVTDNHRIEFSTLYSREADDETREQRGTAQTVAAGELFSRRLRYVARDIWFNRLGARHKFPIMNGKHRVQLDYFASYSTARRDEPGMRRTLYVAAPGCLDLGLNQECDGNLDTSQTGGFAGHQLFTKLRDDNVGGALNLEIPFDQWSGLKTTLKFGGWAEGKWRDFGVRRFAYIVTSGFERPGTPDNPLNGTGNVINDGTIGGGVPPSMGGTQPWSLRELTNPQDNYRASQELYAGYGMLTLPFARWVRVSGGARLEVNEIRVEPYDLFADPDDPPVDCETSPARPECLDVSLQNLNVLPALSFIFSPKLDDKLGTMNVRAMGAQTLARPEFRELAPFQFTDFVGGFTKQGNPDLKQTTIWNAELRWEWFPKPTEVIAVTGFYKYFRRPIEQVGNANVPPIISFVNARAAQNVGAELELRKSLGFVVKKGTPARPILNRFGIGSNFAYIYSRVDLKRPCYEPGGAPAVPMDDPTFDDYVERPGCKPQLEAVTSRSRPLQGQSPYVFNVFADYNDDRSGTFVRVLFNTFGRRIFLVGTSGKPDIYEQPVPGLDLVFTQRILAVRKSRDGDLRNELRFEMGATNILNPRARITQGGQATEGVGEGVSVSTGLSWSY